MSLINKSIFFSIYLYFPLTEELVWTLQIATQYLTKTQAEESQMNYRGNASRKH